MEATEDADFFKEETLQQFNVVVFLNTTGDVLDETQQIEFNRFIQAGGGFVGIHAAADTEYDWPWYGDLVGGWFQSHPNDPNVREGRVIVVDEEHEATSGLPAEWMKVDEWYDYRSVTPGASVLLNIDEASYKRPDENPASAPRPISWYREFDGGRMFYTGLGHTAESFSDPLYLGHLWGGIEYAAGDGGPVDFNNATVAPEENRFSKNVLVSNLVEPMELDLLGEGRIVFIERGGAVKIHDESSGATETIATFDVFSGLEEGLLGVAVDPDYASNNWVYFFYSSPDVPEIRLSRFELTGNTLDFESEKMLLSVPVQRDECCHVGGSVEFGPDGNLFVSIGDNTNPHDTGYGPIDEREDRSPWDAQKSSANTADLRGKILRIKPQADGTYSIPEGNLFPPDGSEGRPEIYVMGNRNPFRISIDKRTGFLYWGEVGPDAGADSTTRGSRGYDEVNQARGPGFFGWPYFVGNNSPYHDHNFETYVTGEPFDPAHPMNDSPNNTGARELPPAQPAFIWYPYGPSEEFPMVGEGGRNAMAGPVYYVDDYDAGDARFPPYYDGKLFIYEWMRGWIMAVTMDENGDLIRMEPFLSSIEFSNPMDMLFAPDGSLYVLEYGPLWFSGSPEASLSHITYVAGNRAPEARIAADQNMGAAPLTVSFTSESMDYDGDALTFAWDFGSGDISSEKNPVYTFEQAGAHRVSLTVTDDAGEQSSTEFEVLAGNDVPQLSLAVTRGNGSFYWDDASIDYEVRVSDTEDGSLENGNIDPASVTLTIDYLERGADLVMPALGHQAMMDASRSLLGKTLVENSDCSACHQLEEASVGPSYVAISERYRDDATAPEVLAQKVIEGGSGVWGDLAMAPHPQLALDEAQKMMEYILEANGATPFVESLPLEGTYTTTAHEGKSEEGVYILMATYTDRGGSEIGPLTVRESIMLRSPRLSAAAYDRAEGTQRFRAPDDAPGGLGGQDILLGTHGGVATYEQIDLTNVGGIRATFAVAPTFTSGGTVDVYLDTIDGPLLGTFEVEQGMVEMGAKELTLNFDPVNGVHDLHFVYRNEDEDGLVCIGIYFDFLQASGV